jgi:hypothetical protein
MGGFDGFAGPLGRFGDRGGFEFYLRSRNSQRNDENQQFRTSVHS